jgi:O-antigen/teichoic acid export membrane protein
MSRPTDPAQATRSSRKSGLPLVLWAALAAVTVVLLFPLLHLHGPVGHSPAIVAAGVGGTVVGSLGHARTAGRVSRRRSMLVGILGGGLGLFVLHVLPLLHGLH